EQLPSSEFVDDGWGDPSSGEEATVGDESFDLSAGDELVADESALVDDGSFGEEDNAPPAAAASSAHATDEMPVDDEVPAELMDVFIVEAADHLQIIARTLSALQSAPEDRDTLQELRRSVHTLKGAAGMVGYRTVSQLAHRMEDLLDAL